jgi:hypothetical protein
VSADVPRDKADAMWATLRDALGLRPGHATARGVDGGGTKPTLTDEEREALRRMLPTIMYEPHRVAVESILQRLG